MKNNTSITSLILIIVPLVFGCRGPVKEEKKNRASTGALSLHIGDDKYIAIDKKESVVTWKGASLMGANSHRGYVHISKGELRMENDQLTGGTVEIDMNTIEDEKYGSDNGLVKHLKNPDFFDVKKFPFATIAITKVESTNGEQQKVNADLTIKGITNPVAFPVKIAVKDGMVKANGKLAIDRTYWGISYKSGKFFNTLANQAISDSIEFDIKIIAKK